VTRGEGALTLQSPRIRWDNRVPGGKCEWLTPPDLVRSLGEFDLDPCAPIVRPWDTAKRHLTIFEDGLLQPWRGRVWLNPPFGSKMIRWVAKLAHHGNGIVLLPARTETRLFFDLVWDAADAVLFLRGRFNFYHVTGQQAPHNSGVPFCLVAYGRQNVAALEKIRERGHFLDFCRAGEG